MYDDRRIFESVKLMLRSFKNIVLLLPDKDERKALEIMEHRSTGYTRDNEKFLKSQCNKELDTMIIYGNGRQPSEITEDIIIHIQDRKKRDRRDEEKEL